MALVSSPDLTKETKYSLVKDKIVKPPSPEIANVLVHSNGQLPNGLGREPSSQETKDEGDAERKSSGRAASTPASQSSPRPRSAGSLSSKKEAYNEEEEEENQLDKSEQLSITSATDNGEDDDDVVVTPVEDKNSRPTSAKSGSSLLAAATYKPEGQASRPASARTVDLEPSKSPEEPASNPATEDSHVSIKSPSLNTTRPTSPNKSSPNSARSSRPSSANVPNDNNGVRADSRPVSAKSNSPRPI